MIVIIGKRSSGKSALANCLSQVLLDHKMLKFEFEVTSADLSAADADSSFVFDNCFCDPAVFEACMNDARTAIVTMAYPFKTTARPADVVYVAGSCHGTYARAIYDNYVSRTSPMSIDDFLEEVKRPLAKFYRTENLYRRFKSGHLHL